MRRILLKEYHNNPSREQSIYNTANLASGICVIILASAWAFTVSTDGVRNNMLYTTRSTYLPEDNA